MVYLYRNTRAFVRMEIPHQRRRTSLASKVRKDVGKRRRLDEYFAYTFTLDIITEYVCRNCNNILVSLVLNSLYT